MSKPRLPAEWEHQYAIQLTWPHAAGAWGQAYQTVESCLTSLVLAVTPHQKVIITAVDERQQQQLLNQFQNIECYVAKSNDIWTRDHGPITVYQNHQNLLLNFTFNGWGCKFPADLDNALTASLFKQGAYPNTMLETIPFVLEGGAIDTDGQGTLLTTTSCLLNKNRNSPYTHAQIENTLQALFGIKRFIWLSQGEIIGDDTDGHIDTLARFVNEKAIAFVPCHPNIEKELAAFNYELIALPIPNKKFDEKGNQLPATYANFLMTNEAILVPLYQDPQDNSVLSLFEKIYPNKKIVGINCLPLITQGGSLHCATMQIPQSKEQVND